MNGFFDPQQAFPGMPQTQAQSQPIVPPAVPQTFFGSGSMNPQPTSFTGYQAPQAGQQFSGQDIGAINAGGQQGGGSNWFNDGTMQGVGSAMQGLGALGGIGLGFMQLKDLKKAREQSQANFEKNYAAQKDSVNEDRAKRNNYARRMSGNKGYQAKMLA